MYEFITAAEKAQAERILDRLGDRDYFIRLDLEEASADVVKAMRAGEKEKENLWTGRFFGMMDMLERLDLITFEENDVLTRYFIDKQVDAARKNAA